MTKAKSFRLSSVLTKKGLREFLKTTKLKFKNGSPYYCPVAKYLKVATKAKKVSVGAYAVSIGYDNYLLPKWATTFIDKIDAGGVRVITAKEALALL